MTPSLVLFWVLAIISVGAAVLMVANQNAVRSALYLVVTFLGVAVFYVTLSAQFIAAVQVIVYAGAIMVLFLFVIMLLNLGARHALRETGRLQIGAALILSVVFAGLAGVPVAVQPAGIDPDTGADRRARHGAERWLEPVRSEAALAVSVRDDVHPAAGGGRRRDYHGETPHLSRRFLSSFHRVQLLY